MHLVEQTVCDLIALSQAFVIAIVVHRKGPRDAGSKTVIIGKAIGVGTIGGGALEAKAMPREVQLIEQGRSAAGANAIQFMQPCGQRGWHRTEFNRCSSPSNPSMVGPTIASLPTTVTLVIQAFP